PPPVPTIWAAARPCSRSRRRTAGVIRASGLPGASAAPASPATAVGAVEVAEAAVAAARSGRSSEPAGPAAGSFTGGCAGAGGAADAPPAAASRFLGSSSVGPSGSGPDCSSNATGGVAAASPPSSAVSITAISALFGTVAPSSTRISLRIPPNGEGTSALTLSVIPSRSGSYFSTVSPGCFSHLPIVPSATLSPSWGIVTLATGCRPPGPAAARAATRCASRQCRASRADTSPGRRLAALRGVRLRALLEAGNTARGHIGELGEQRLVDLREVEAGLALAAFGERLGDRRRQRRALVDRHQVEAHVALAEPGPADV